MTVTINGTTGVAGVDGTASTPAIQGNDTNTGIFFPAADTIAFAEGGAEVARFDSSGNLGVGVTAPTAQLATLGNVNIGNNSSANPASYLRFGATQFGASDIRPVDEGSHKCGLSFYTDGTADTTINPTERMRINSSGNLLINTTSQLNASNSYLNILYDGNNFYGSTYKVSTTAGTSIAFVNSSGSGVGSISQTASATAFNTSSDYRLKENITPMTGALNVVQQLKPVTYNWKVDGSSGQGFIAHELQEVVPECVTGEKDAVNEDGTIKAQGIDTSFLTATLTAAIQELKAELDTVKTELATLKGQA